MAHGTANVKLVQLEGLVALKIIKHCQEESIDGEDLVQGVLLGLVVDQRLEITNCFPMPRITADDDPYNVKYQMEMMRNLRHVNVDHLHVGWYQSTMYGSFVNKPLLDSQFEYQSQIDESVVLIYDPAKTVKNQLSLRAYKLSDEMMELKKVDDFSLDKIKAKGLSFSTMFEEIPLVIRNSHLINVTLCEIESRLSSESSNYGNLDMGTGNSAEGYMKRLMDAVDELAQDTNKFVHYQRNFTKQQQIKREQLMKRHLENQKRLAQGEEPIGEDDIHRNFKQMPPAQRLDGMLLSARVDTLSQELMQFSSQSLSKILIADAVHPEQSSGN